MFIKHEFIWEHEAHLGLNPWIFVPVAHTNQIQNPIVVKIYIYCHVFQITEWHRYIAAISSPTSNRIQVAIFPFIQLLYLPFVWVFLPLLLNSSMLFFCSSWFKRLASPLFPSLVDKRTYNVHVWYYISIVLFPKSKDAICINCTLLFEALCYLVLRSRRFPSTLSVYLFFSNSLSKQEIFGGMKRTTLGSRWSF